MGLGRVAALIAAMGLALCGCQVTGEVENLAYVLVLGVDRLEGGQLELTAKVPQIGRSAGPQGGEEGGGSPYLVFCATGSGLSQAFAALERATPRQMILSHIEMLVVSEALAREADFPALIDQLVRTPHLYATAPLVVCEGTARAFVEAQETVIGTRMSSEIRAMLKHYADRGYIPESSAAEISYACNSIYSDPVAMRASLAREDGDIPASPMKQRYGGAALFREGVLVRLLDVDEARLLNLVRGGARSIEFDCDGESHELTLEGRPDIRVNIDGDSVDIRVTLTFSTVDELCRKDARRAGEWIERGLTRLIQDCQRDGTEPFGFAEAAAPGFLTIPDWLSFGWRERFSDATVSVSARVRAS